MTSKGKNRKGNKKSSTESVQLNDKLSTSEQKSTIDKKESVSFDIEKSVEIKSILPASAVNEDANSYTEVETVSTTAPSVSALNTPSGSKVFQYEDAYVGTENEDIDFYVPDKQFLNDSLTSSPSEFDKSIIISDIYTNNVLSPLRNAPEEDRTNPSLLTGVDVHDKPPHPISSFASPSVKPSHLKTSRSADSLASEDFSGIWRDVPGDNSTDDRSESRSAGIALDASSGAHSPTAPVEVEVEVATASRIATASVVQAVTSDGIHSSPLHHSESGSELGTFIEKIPTTTSSSSNNVVAHSTTTEEVQQQEEEKHTEWRTLSNEELLSSVEGEMESASDLTAVERVEEVVRELAGRVRTAYDCVSGKSTEGTANTSAATQLIQMVVNIALFLPSLLIRFYTYLIVSTLRALSSAVTFGWNTTRTVVWAPVTIAKFVMRTALSLAVSFLNLTPGGHKIPTSASNGHVERY